MVSIEQVLTEQFGVSERDIEKAKTFQQKHPSPLEEIVANMGAIAEEDLPKLYAKLLGVAVEDHKVDISTLAEAGELVTSSALKNLVELGWYPLGSDLFATSNPLNSRAQDIVHSLGFELNLVIISKEKEGELKGYFSAPDSDLTNVTLSTVEEERLRELASEAPVVNLLNTLIAKGLKAGASDMHIEPVQNKLRVRYRVDGVLQSEETIPKSLELAILTRLKILSSMDIAEKRRPQDGKIDFKVAQEELDIRVSCLPLNEGESVVMRFLRKNTNQLELGSLGVEQDIYDYICRDISKSSGVVLLTGPTGSGKTTTLYTFLNRLNNDNVKVVTLEDPVEYQLEGVNQVQVNSEIGYDFATGLRSIVRQDPDIIMVGEIRDKETARIALQSALTGHLVFSTLHTNDAPSAYTRLIDLGVEPFLLDAALISILAQRLVRSFCSCAQPMSSDQVAEIDKRYHLSELAEKHGIALELKRPVGCSNCSNTGYKGRVAIIEYMDCDEELAALNNSEEEFLFAARKLNKQRGHRNLLEDGLLKVARGVTSIQEVVKVAS